MSAPSVLADGTWIDNFRVVRRLGRGGFGVTYLAEEFREWEAGSGTGSMRPSAWMNQVPLFRIMTSRSGEASMK